jgi:hypothetical protein
MMMAALPVQRRMHLVVASGAEHCDLTVASGSSSSSGQTPSVDGTLITKTQSISKTTHYISYLYSANRHPKLYTEDKSSHSN